MTSQVLPLLAQVGALISGSADLKKTLGVLLQILERQMGVVRGTVTLYHQRTGKDVRDIPPSSDTDEDLSVVCVPILRGRKVLGTIRVERLYDTPERLEQDVELLGIVAGMVAQEVELFLSEEENRRLREELQVRSHPSNLIGDSPAMRNVYHLVEKVSKTRATVLILGESGVGKELVASAIHYASLQAAGPFVRFTCSALPEALAEGELFGPKGRFEEAHGGTIFLDDVAELTLALQAKLLRVLQEPTSAAEPRLLAATSRNLEALVAQGKFRQDLYYRLNVFPISIPPLRDRGADVLTLADHFLARSARESGKVVRGLSTPALNLLMAHSWPGNVRELENCLERALILTDDGYIHAHHLPPSLHASEAVLPLAPDTSLEDHLASIEKSHLVRTLEETRGNMAEAARRLGLTKRMMLLRMEKFQLDYTVFRRAPVEASPFRR